MSYVAVRREEEKERRRAEMVDAAEELYAKVGWDAVTMDRVARSARLSRALLYVYFRDKNDLLHAITERALIELRKRFVAAAGTHATGIDQVQAIGRAYVLFQQEKPYRFDACTPLPRAPGRGPAGRGRLRRRGRCRHRRHRQGAHAGPGRRHDPQGHRQPGAGLRDALGVHARPDPDRDATRRSRSRARVSTSRSSWKARSRMLRYMLAAKPGA